MDQFSRKRPREHSDYEHGRKKRGSGEQDFSVDVMWEDAPSMKIKHRRWGTFVVGHPGQEYTVRVKIHPSAWRLTMHKNPRWSYWFVKLYIDDVEIRARFLEAPYMDNEDVVWTFSTLKSGHAFAFSDRRGGPSAFSEEDQVVGKIRVTFQAAEPKPNYNRGYNSQRSNNNYPRKNKNDFLPAPKVSFDEGSKDKFSTLRTVKGRRKEDPAKRRNNNSGSFTSAPARLAADFVYHEVEIQYDTAEHLRYRGILRPHVKKDHRIFFPNTDFKKKNKAPTGDRRILDLTGDDVREYKEKGEGGDDAGVKSEARRGNLAPGSTGPSQPQGEDNDDDDGEPWIPVYDDANSPGPANSSGRY